ncbi:MAG: hypothetical protein Q9227_004105 [Pyrenula ochraceoflavens]
MPHEDGAAYHPIVATVSLGAPIVLDIYEKTESGERAMQPRWRILQEPRSLLVTTEEMYTEVLHGISETRNDQNLGQDTVANWNLVEDKASFESGMYERRTRVSLTYRDVLKVSKIVLGSVRTEPFDPDCNGHSYIVDDPKDPVADPHLGLRGFCQQYAFTESSKALNEDKTRAQDDLVE